MVFPRVSRGFSAQESAYDEIAEMYHELWADWYLPAALPALERLFFSAVAPGSRVLDVCCGSGHVTQELVSRGYNVTGVDNSAELIRLARKRLPSIDFVVQDARALKLDGRVFEAALSTFDSLNHLLTLDDLVAALAGVQRALEPGGLFVFDMNLEEAYLADLRQWSVDVKEQAVGLVRGTFDRAAKRASTELIWFVRAAGSECWQQRRSVVKQQCYARDEVLKALKKTGFRHAQAISAAEAGVTSELGFGRTYFVVRA